jgi:peptidoglycan/xylan/chitin deacetylase (PgdA/CDA1 family)
VTVSATAKRAARRLGLRRSTIAATRIACERQALALTYALHHLTPGPFPEREGELPRGPSAKGESFPVACRAEGLAVGTGRVYEGPAPVGKGQAVARSGRRPGLGSPVLPVALAARNLATAAPRILCYHSVGTPAWGVNDVAPRRFRRQIEMLVARGYRFRPADEVSRDGRPGEIAITFDDGLASVARNAAPLLFDLGIPWTLFVVTDWADGRHGFGDGVMLDWRAIERLAARGATIASHSATHADFGRLTREQARAELTRSRQMLRERIGIESAAFAIPLGCRRNWSAVAAEEARAAGFTTIYAQGEAKRSAGTAGRTFVTRFDNDRLFSAALAGAFDRWEEWV